jgi:ABC-type lipoprotein export system ATPase subunit
MRIREVFFKNIRNFREDRLFSFVDPLTDETRQISVLAGINGSGKTTVLEAIDSLLDFVISNRADGLVQEAFKDGLIGIEIELSEQERWGKQLNLFTLFLDKDKPRFILQIVVGHAKFKTHEYIKFREQDIQQFYPIDKSQQPEVVNNPGSIILKELSKSSELGGGYLYFPYNRQLGRLNQRRIEKPSKQQDWLFHYRPSVKWKDSLEQLWVWQNYLDLEQGTIGKNLKPFIQIVEKALGNERNIYIQEGEVYVNTGWKDADGTPAKVRIDQLPSGEQQVLLLLGEISRRMRKGAVIAVDEVENSLHPTLQRLVMWNLRQIAKERDGQVIVSTHSLEIINSVRGGAFINLDYPEKRFNLPVDDTGREIS